MSPPSFWSRRTRLEKGLILFSVSVFTFCCILLAMLSSKTISNEDVKVIS